MTTKKITKNEFTIWGKEIWELAETVMKDSEENPEEKAMISKIISAFCVRIIQQNTFALESFNGIFSKKFEKLPEEIRKKKFNFPCEDGVKRKMTGQEWSQYLHQRVEDYHRTQVGKDIGDSDLPLIVQRLKKIILLDGDETQKKEKEEQLLVEVYQDDDKENYNLIYGILDLNKKFSDITGGGELFKIIGDIEEAIQKSPYLFEDFSQILFRAQEAIEKKKDKPEIPEKKQKEKKKEEKKHQVKTLEEEIKELERQKKELEEKISNISLDPAKKASLEEDLKENKKQREATQARLDNLQRELKNTDNDSKNNLAIGLGIFAAVIAVICLIILLVRPSRQRNQY